MRIANGIVTNSARLVGLGVLAAMLIGLGGCLNGEHLASLRDRAVESSKQRQAEIERLTGALETMAPTHPDRGAFEVALAEAIALRAASDAMARRIEETLAQADAPTDPVSQLVGLVAPWMPEPVRTPLVLGGALAASVLRGWQLRRGLISVADGIGDAMQSDPAFSERYKMNAGKVRAKQTGLARKLVDQTLHERLTAPAADSQASASEAGLQVHPNSDAG